MCCAGVAYFFITPWLDRKIEVLRQRSEVVRQPPAVTDQQRLQQERYQDFVDRLPTLAERSDVLKALFDASTSSGFTLSQAEYQLQPNVHGGYYRLQMSIPVTTSYPKLRTFLDALLVSLPSASIDEIALRRETVSALAVSANLKLSIFFKESN